MPSIRLERGTSSPLITTGAAPGNATLTSGSRALSAEYDNASGLYLFGDFELSCTFASSPTAGQQVDLFIVPCNDGTNYTDGNASVNPAANLLAGWFNVRAVNTAQILTARGPIGQRIELPPCKFKIVLLNDTSQTISASWALTLFPSGLKTV